MTSLLPTPEPPDPVEGALGHFDHSNWVKASLKALDAGTVHSAGGTVTGVLNAEALTVNDPASEDAFIDLVGDRDLGLRGKTAGGSLRWSMNLGDGTVEGGGNSGSLFNLFAYSDAGALLHTVLKAARSDGLLEVKGSPTVAKGIATKEYVDNAMPLGAIIAYGGSTAPAGWHICNGSAHGSAALQALIGSANTPDLSGRFIVGAGTGYNPKDVGGVASNTLTPAQTATKGHGHPVSSVAETQEHVHGVDPPLTWSSGHNQDHSHSGTTGWMNQNNVHNHGIREGITTGDSEWWIDTADKEGASDIVRNNAILNTDTNHQHNFGTSGASVDHAHYVDIVAFNSGGRSAAHTHGIQLTATTDASATAPIENRPPYYALVYIIKKV
jgi:microcystin-dependent protein